VFHRFSPSARSSVIHAGQVADSEGCKFIEPKHILIALVEQQPALFERASEHPVDLEAIHAELRQPKTSLPASQRSGRLKLSQESRQVLIRATEQARSCWEEWEAPRRKGHVVLPEDVEYWEVRMKQPLRKRQFTGRIASFLLRRPLGVDDRHLLLGLLDGPESPVLAVLTKQGVTLETARQRLCRVPHI
jgi:ATP-dependent Clp protease ATP-binding subunit ClpA